MADRTIIKDLGPVTAYAMARDLGGYEGTEQEFAEGLAASATASVDAQSAAVRANRSAEAASTDAAAAHEAYEGVVALTDDFIVGPPQDVGCTESGNVVSITWRDPHDSYATNGAAYAKWGSTRLVVKHGGFPEGPDDGETLVESTTRDEYRYQPFVKFMGSGSDYYFALFSRTTALRWNVADAPRFTVGDASFGTFLQMLRSGTVSQFGGGVSAGSVLPWRLGGLWPDMPWQVAHLDYDADLGDPRSWTVGQHAHNAVLVPQYCPAYADAPDAVQLPYDAPESTWGATEDETFLVGKAYYRLDIEAATYVQLVDGTDYVSGTPVAEHEGEVYERNHAERISNGSNRWATSNIRQWLNASGASGDWYAPQNPFDVLSSNANYRQGFLTGASEAFVGAIATVRNRTVRNSVAKASQGEGGGYDETLDKVWMPSTAEYFNTHQAASVTHEGRQFDLYRNVYDTAELRKRVDPGGTARFCWLRSLYVSSVRSAMVVGISGTSVSRDCSTLYSFLPAICIA